MNEDDAAELREDTWVPSGSPALSFEYLAFDRLAPDYYDSESVRRAIDDEPPLPEFLGRLNDVERRYQAALEADLRTATGNDAWAVPVRQYRVGEAFGGELVPDAAQLVAAATRLGETIVTWVALAAIARLAFRRLAELRGSDPGVSGGMAALLASDAIFEASNEVDLIFAFSTPLAPRTPPENAQIATEPDGYVVGFRGESVLWIAVVSGRGAVLSVTRLPVPGDLPAWWRG